MTTPKYPDICSEDRERVAVLPGELDADVGILGCGHVVSPVVGVTE